MENHKSTVDGIVQVSTPVSTTDETHVLVNRDQLAQLLAQNAELKTDVTALVGVFAQFEGLFTGHGLVSAVPTILKLINDKSKMAAIEAIVPIIHKYSHEQKTLNQ